ncbi:hypothetical protein AB0I84_47930 [Streptomyces spectabilis]|uniref:2'-5' RNA ligase family protein n=1 Tax=Streptomyces spectabilis TaxID=68270 RepID=UPI0033F9DC1F
MESFFGRVGRVWPSGRRDLHWHILPTRSEAEALMAPYTGFDHPVLCGVAPLNMHCTLLHAVGLGHTDTDDVRALVGDVGGYAEGVEPFWLTFDRPSVGAFAVEIAGWPGGRFTALVDTLTTLTERRFPGQFTPAPSRYPHMSLAYTVDGSDDVSAADLRAALAAIEQPLSGTVYVDRLHLVEQWHDGAAITWNPIAEVPLTGVTL